MIKDSPVLKHVATLPCEIFMPENCNNLKQVHRCLKSVFCEVTGRSTVMSFLAHDVSCVIISLNI